MARACAECVLAGQAEEQISKNSHEEDSIEPSPQSATKESRDILLVVSRGKARTNVPTYVSSRKGFERSERTFERCLKNQRGYSARSIVPWQLEACTRVLSRNCAR